MNRCSPSPIAAVIYFCSFVLLCGLVLVNFVIGVIIDNFQSSCQSDNLPISKASVEHFAQVRCSPHCCNPAGRHCVHSVWEQQARHLEWPEYCHTFVRMT